MLVGEEASIVLCCCTLNWSDQSESSCCYTRTEPCHQYRTAAFLVEHNHLLVQVEGCTSVLLVVCLIKIEFYVRISLTSKMN